MILNLLLVIHLIVAITIVILVLMQQGKGSQMGAAFGASGSSQSLFGARGSSNFLSRTTAILVTVFFLSSLGLAYLYAQQVDNSRSLLDETQQSIDTSPANESEVPATEVPTAPGEPQDNNTQSEVPNAPTSSAADQATNESEVPTDSSNDAPATQPNNEQNNDSQ